MDVQTEVITAEKGTVELRLLGNGRREVKLRPNDPALYIPRWSCESSFPTDVIQDFLAMSYEWLCEYLARYDDPEYLVKVLGQQLFAYVGPADFRGKRLLDFGCGTGASTFTMAALLPDTEIVGVELSEDGVKLAQRVQAVKKLPNVQFLVSPDPKEPACRHWHLRLCDVERRLRTPTYRLSD